MLPAVLAAGVILLLAGGLIFWPSDDEATEVPGKKPNQTASMRAGDPSPSGIKGREIDSATGRPKPRVNPALRLPELGTAPGPPPDEGPPDFQSKEEEIEWYEKRLSSAQSILENRRKFVERLPAARERFERRHPDPSTRDDAWQQREDTVKDNLEKAQAKVEELEAKLAELRGE